MLSTKANRQDREGEYNRQDRKEEYNRQDRQGVLAGFRKLIDKIYRTFFVSFLHRYICEFGTN